MYIYIYINQLSHQQIYILNIDYLLRISEQYSSLNIHEDLIKLCYFEPLNFFQPFNSTIMLKN